MKGANRADELDSEDSQTINGQLTDDEDEDKDIPDGGQGWAVVAAGFLSQFIMFGTSNIWGNTLTILSFCLTNCVKNRLIRTSACRNSVQRQSEHDRINECGIHVHAHYFRTDASCNDTRR